MDLSYLYVTCSLVFIILLLLFRYYWTARKKFEGFPFCHLLPKLLYRLLTGKIPKDVPFTSYAFSNLMEIFSNDAEGGCIMTYFLRPVLFIFSEEALKFFSNEKAATDKSSEYIYIQEGMGAGIGTSNGERWKKHRKLINPAFHIGMLKDKAPLFNEHAWALVKDMSKMTHKPYVNLLDVLKTNYFNALSESVFGLKQIEENKAANLRCFSLIDSGSEMIVKRIAFPWFRPNFLLNFSSFGRTYKSKIREYNDFISKVINDMIELIDSKKSTDTLHSKMNTDRFSNHLQKSFTYILLNQHLNDPSFTFEDLHAEVSTILITGYDTVTYTTLWCLFMLALHPEVQKKALKEALSVSDTYITYEETCNLTYLEAIIMESLRLYPIVPIFARSLSADVQYGKNKVYKGTTIAFVPYLSHRNSDIFPDPEKFVPERFLNPESKLTSSFIPFSVANRVCLGKKYAIIEMKIFLAHILRNYKINSLDKREDIALCWNIALIPDRPIRLKITPRNLEEKCFNNSTLLETHCHKHQDANYNS